MIAPLRRMCIGRCAQFGWAKAANLEWAEWPIRVCTTRAFMARAARVRARREP
jgi:hypothetical protein